MADEKKTYLINIESNLTKYAEEALEAKKKVDELKESNKQLKDAGKENTAEFQANSAALRTAQKEYKEAQKLVDLQTAANHSNVNSRKQLGEIVRMEQLRLGKLEGTIQLNAKGQRVLSDEYKKAVKNLKDAKDAVIAYDKAQSDGRSNIGRYGESVKGAFKSIGTSILGFASGTAIAIAALDKLKQSFLETERGGRLLTQSVNILKTVFQGIISGDNLKEVLKNAILANVAAKESYEIRKQDRMELVAIAKMETEINKLKFQAADITKSEKEQMQLLTLAQKREEELIAFKIADKQEELVNVNKLLATRKNDSALLDQQAQIMAEIVSLEGDRSLRIQSRIAGLEQKEIDRLKKEKKEAEDLIKENHANTKKWSKEKWDNLVEQEERGNKFRAEFLKLFGIENDAFQIQEQTELNAKRKKAAEDAAEAEINIAKKKAETISDIEVSVLNGISAGADAAFEAKRNRLQAEMEAELSNKKLTEKQKNEIRLRYAKEQQKADISQALINGALAVGNALATTKPFIPAGIIAAGVAAVQTAAQVAVIKSQNFSGSSGGGGGSSTISSTPMAQRMMAGQVAPSIFTQSQMSQTQLNAIPAAGQLTVEQLTEAFKNLPAPVTTIEDINARQSSTNKIVSRATI